MSSDDTLSLNNHELLLQLTAMFRQFDARQLEFDARQREFDARQREFDARQREFDAQLRQHDGRLGNIERTIESRLYDTRPISEAVQHQISELHSDLQQQITELRAEVQKGFRMVNRKVGLFGEQVAELCAYQRDMEDRIEKPEGKS